MGGKTGEKGRERGHEEAFGGVRGLAGALESWVDDFGNCWVFCVCVCVRVSALGVSVCVCVFAVCLCACVLVRVNVVGFAVWSCNHTCVYISVCVCVCVFVCLCVFWL